MVHKQQDFYHISLKLLLKNKRGEILVLKALDDGNLAGYYDVPGGRIDTDEFTTPFEDILRREVKEEIGSPEVYINLNPVAVSRGIISASKMHGGRGIHIFYVFFEAEYKGGDIVISDEHTDHKWINLKEIDLKDYFTAGILEGVEMYMRT